MNTEKFVFETRHFWTGVFDIISDDMPDGAWFQCHVDAADGIIEEYRKGSLSGWPDFSEIPEGVDGHDIATAWLAIDPEDRA